MNNFPNEKQIAVIPAETEARILAAAGKKAAAIRLGRRMTAAPKWIAAAAVLCAALMWTTERFIPAESPASETTFYTASETGIYGLEEYLPEETSEIYSADEALAAELDEVLERWDIGSGNETAADNQDENLFTVSDIVLTLADYYYNAAEDAEELNEELASLMYGYIY